jgi:hypothetical protein
MSQFLYLKITKRQYNYSLIEDSKVVLVFERNNGGLKKLSSFVWTDKWLICLSKCHVSFLKYVNSIFHIWYFDPDYPTSGLTVTGLASVYCILFEHLITLIEHLILLACVIQSCICSTYAACWLEHQLVHDLRHVSATWSHHQVLFV